MPRKNKPKGKIYSKKEYLEAFPDCHEQINKFFNEFKIYESREALKYLRISISSLDTWITKGWLREIDFSRFTRHRFFTKKLL